MTLHLAADVGGTRMRVGLVDQDGAVLQRATCPTASASDGAAALATLVSKLDTPGDGPAVVGLPGRIDYEAGVLEMAPNLPPAWIPSFREAMLGEVLGRVVHLANDADLAAVGETWFGAGRGHADVLYVTISTGIGAGLILRDRLVAGRRSSCELGHTTIDMDRTVGGHRTVEHLGSGTALAEAAAREGLPGGEELAAMVRAGHEAATRIWNQTIRLAAVGIANMLWVAAPSMVVIGGGIGANGDIVLGPVADVVREYGPPGLAEHTVLAVGELGGDAGLAGAAAWYEARGLG